MPKYLPGDNIIQSKPLVHVLNLTQKGKRCDYCFTKGSTLRRCSKCRFMFYCDQKCQSKDWKRVHKLGECNYYSLDIAENQSILVKLDTPRLLLRFYLLIHYHPEINKQKYPLHDGTYRCLDDLMDHRENIKKDEERLQIFEEICFLFTKLKIPFNKEVLFRLYGVLFINGFSVLNELLTEIGHGLYIEVSVFDHSCKPNAVFLFDGITIKIRSMRNIEDGEKIYITYLDITMPTSIRKNDCRKKYYFECECERCNLGIDIISSFEELTGEFNDTVSNKNWIKAYRVGVSLMSIYENYFEYNHPELTVHILQLIQVRRNLGEEVFNLKNQETRDLLAKLNSNILITHGKEHSLYKTDFMEIIKDLKAI